MPFIRRLFFLSMFLGLLMLGLWTSDVWAQKQPFLNLGLTSFLDGTPPSGPGLYLQNYLVYYHASTLKNGQGQAVPIPNIDIASDVHQLVYLDHHSLPTKAKWGLNLLLPVVFSNSQGPEGVGDLFFGPYIQWDPIIGKNGPIFAHRVELTAAFPTGKYERDELVNPGSNTYYFNPYWAATIFPLPKWNISWRIHYLWNGTNNDPNINQFPGARTAQAGQAFHVNFASDYEVVAKRLRLGLNGFYLKQFTNSKVNGASIEDSREQVLGIGAGALIHLTRNDHLFLNGYYETLARNRPEGSLFNMRYVHNFKLVKDRDSENH